LGDFNIENALAATCVGLSENISLETIKNALEKITGVPGRMESVSNDKGLNILIDYAVTPDSLEKLYDLIGKLRQQNNGKILAVFGSCGERDRGKRPLMGEIVAQKADYVFVTNEDPYNEDPQQIVDEVFAGVLRVKEKGVGCRIIMDRREAIRTALQMAGARDFVVVTGKGAEETMAIGKERIPWNDKQVISEELQKI
jgi:UDP-N-acetylmuramoyl-L-alanyl-D-glutamate--2,6-diaminopimelate ligase